MTFKITTKINHNITPPQYEKTHLIDNPEQELLA